MRKRFPACKAGRDLSLGRLSQLWERSAPPPLQSCQEEGSTQLARLPGPPRVWVPPSGHRGASFSACRSGLAGLVAAGSPGQRCGCTAWWLQAVQASAAAAGKQQLQAWGIATPCGSFQQEQSGRTGLDGPPAGRSLGGGGRACWVPDGLLVNYLW